MKALRNSKTALAVAALSIFVGTASSVGCQVTDSGQTLPSGLYLLDDILYTPKGPENKVHDEATRLQAYHADQAAKK